MGSNGGRVLMVFVVVGLDSEGAGVGEGQTGGRGRGVGGRGWFFKIAPIEEVMEVVNIIEK